jgi:magnesium transporter
MTEATTAPNSTIPELNPELLQLLAGDPEDLVAVCLAHEPTDVALALRELPGSTAATIIASLPFGFVVQVFDRPELEHHRYDVIRRLEPSLAARLIEALSSDQQAGLFRELPTADRAPILAALSPDSRHNLELLLRYPPESAGGIMTVELASVDPAISAGEALEYVRTVAQSKETVYAVYLVEPETGHLTGVVSLRELLIADQDLPVARASHVVNLVTVDPLTDREDVARLIGKYNLLAVPVVDRSRRLLGIVTVDDVIDALIKEQTEDLQKLGGVEALDVPYTEISFGRMLRKRAGWLCALFLGEMLTATAMGRFENEIARAVVLSLFIPLIISSGGNSGSQATTLIIRALALRELKLKDWWRVALRELPTGLALGSVLGVIGVIRILLWQQLGWYDYGPHYALVAFTVGTALVGVVTFGSLTGSMLPFILRRLGFDPASASAPFVATLVDVTGLIIYFSVALVLLRGTLL